MLRIDLGAGDDPLPGFESLDVRLVNGVKYVSDVRKPPFQDNSVDELAARHLIDQFLNDAIAGNIRITDPKVKVYYRPKDQSINAGA